jgi:hypothetical protein
MAVVIFLGELTVPICGMFLANVTYPMGLPNGIFHATIFSEIIWLAAEVRFFFFFFWRRRDETNRLIEGIDPIHLNDDHPAKGRRNCTLSIT